VDETGIGLKQYVRGAKISVTPKTAIDQSESLKTETISKSAFDEGELEAESLSHQVTQSSK
jgi:hypothetical protein